MTMFDLLAMEPAKAAPIPERNLISFDAEGQIQFGPKLSREDIAALGLTPEMRLRRTDPETEHRLALHRNKITGA